MTEAFAVCVTVNGQTYERRVEGRRLLVDFIRHDLGLYGTHVGCEQGVCGMCTVQLNGEPVKSCLMLAPQAHGAVHYDRRVARRRGRAPSAPGGVP